MLSTKTIFPHPPSHGHGWHGSMEMGASAAKAFMELLDQGMEGVAKGNKKKDKAKMGRYSLNCGGGGDRFCCGCIYSLYSFSK